VIRQLRAKSSFGILFVCTGNICRSPFAEILTRFLLTERFGRIANAYFAVSSAGTEGVTGAPMDQLSRAELAPWRLDGAAADGFVARRLEPADVQAADLVLTAERHHRSAVVTMVPKALPVTFCLREFARLLDCTPLPELPGDPVSRAAAVVRAASQARGLHAYATVEDDAIPDPMGRPPSVHRAAAGRIAAAVHCLVEKLTSDVAIQSGAGMGKPEAGNTIR
jgi:protein-tyrosine phosphatase